VAETKRPALLRPGADLVDFFSRVGRARRRALLVDYDGTLAPLTADRRHAEPWEGFRAALANIALAPRPTAVWIVSGRTVGDLARLVRLDHVADLWGSHGLERRSRQGCWSGPAPERDASSFLDEVAASLAHQGAAALLERKVYGIAIHERGADAAVWMAAREAMEKRFAPRAAAFGLELLPFDGGLELRPRAFHKGQVVDRAFAELGEGAVVAYLGDDRTDEDAFEALKDRPAGLGVLVRAEPRPTQARAWLRPPEEVLRFLSDWNAACSREVP
jgi:trehalose-phosphatase